MAQTRVGVRLRPTLWNGLLAYYTADNTPNDTLGNYNGTLVNGTTYGAGKINGGFSFDGVNDYVDISPIIPYNSTTDPFSYSMWIYPTKNGTIIDNFNASNLTGINIYISNSYIYLRLSSGAYPLEIRTRTTNTITFNNWYHLVVTYDGSTDTSGVNIYLDSTNKARTTQFNACSSVSLSNNRTRMVSGYFGTGGGLIDEVGVWNRELTASEVTELYNSGSGKQYPTGIDTFWNGALSYFKANNTAYDEIAGYTGTLNNGTTYDTGVIDSAFSFNSSLVQSITTKSPSHNFDSNTTYNMWIKPSSLPGFCMFLHIPSQTQGPGIGLRTGGDLTFFRASVNGELRSGITISTGVWQMITIVYRSGGSNNVDFYVNGSLLHTGSLSVGAVGGSNMYIGSNGASNGVYNGLIDEVSIWDSALSPSKITELYNAGVGKQYPN